jgi:hypothetical protein
MYFVITDKSKQCTMTKSGRKVCKENIYTVKPPFRVFGVDSVFVCR